MMWLISSMFYCLGDNLDQSSANFWQINRIRVSSTQDLHSLYQIHHCLLQANIKHQIQSIFTFGDFWWHNNCSFKTGCRFNQMPVKEFQVRTLWWLLPTTINKGSHEAFCPPSIIAPAAKELSLSIKIKMYPCWRPGLCWLHQDHSFGFRVTIAKNWIRGNALLE